MAGNGLGRLLAGSAAALAATGRFMFPNVLNEPPQQFQGGFPPISAWASTSDSRNRTESGLCGLRRLSSPCSGFYVLSTTCTHLGCTPNYPAAESSSSARARKRVPADGYQFRRPGSRPLERRSHRARRDGQILSTRAGSSSRARTVDRPGCISANLRGNAGSTGVALRSDLRLKSRTKLWRQRPKR
jgi:cytochrome b6-f complex iron-sulfur subunit